MLSGFEDITYELNDQERALLPVLIKGLRNKRGPACAISNRTICERLQKRYGLKISEARIRKLINHIRINDYLPGLVASSKGYYVTMDPNELHRYIKSLEGRENEIRRVKEAAIANLKRITNFKQSNIYE